MEKITSERRRLLHAHRVEKRPHTSAFDEPSCKRARRGQWDLLLSHLKGHVLEMNKLSGDEILALRSGDNFTTDPKLALAYFHCCGCHPDAFVYNNEHLLRGDAVERLKSVVDRGISGNEVSICQNDVANRVSRNKSVWACSSCCEILFGEENVVHLGISELPDTFKVTRDEKYQRFGGISSEVRRSHLQVVERGETWYFLNPELVSVNLSEEEEKDADRVKEDQVVLCKACSRNPRKNKFSIASGHDYGRRGALPELNDVATNCICPVRLFGIDISLSGRFAHGHSICFPSDGPIKCSRVLPHVDEDCQPHVSFIGPRDQWRIKAKTFRHLYEVPVDGVYAWLEVLSEIHSYWRDECIVIDKSLSRQNQLRDFVSSVEARVDASASSTSGDLSDGELREVYADMDLGSDDCVITRKSAVLKEGVDVMASSSNQGHNNAIVDGFLETISSLPFSGYGPSNTYEDDEQCVIAVERADTPITEWNSNGEMLAGAFPTLFMTGGAMLPKGSLPNGLVVHLLRYYDGRFEQSATLIATLFNQLQRHSAIQKAARASISDGEALIKLTALANNYAFREQLEIARAHPESKLARCLNAKLLRILCVVGNRVPFSPFELASAKPKIDAMRVRYDLATHWVTVAPPEHDDLALHRVALLRSSRRWNDRTLSYTQAKFSWGDLPEPLRTSPKARLAVSHRYPALAVRAFQEAFDVVTTDLIRCCASQNVKKSRDFAERERGILSTVAGFTAVVEPQKCGRLHTHMTVYGSTWTPQLLVRSVCNSELQQLAKEWIDSVSQTFLSDEAWEWYCRIRENAKEGAVTQIPRPSELVIPDAISNYSEFQAVAEKCLFGTNIHRHSCTCTKGRRGRYMCRLNRPAGAFEDDTSPIELVILQNGSLWKGERGQVEAQQVTQGTKRIIDKGYDPDIDGSLLRSHTIHPVVWEQHRPLRDSMVVETNLSLSLLSQSHTNASIISCEDAGDCVQEYQRNYMTKESGGLKNTVSIFIAAVNEVQKYPSSADDKDSPLRQAKHLACRTVNAFAGAHEWPLSVMVYALQGNHSFISSDVYWYIFPWHLVRYLDNDFGDGASEEQCDDYCEEGGCENRIEDGSIDPLVALQLDDIINTVEEESQVVQRTLADINRENSFADNCGGNPDTGKSGGTRVFKVEGKTYFLSQAQCYAHRGAHFADYSPAEFESIVDIRPVKRGTDSDGTHVCGRKRRTGFPFAVTHPLYRHYEGCIRAKFKTVMLGGAPPPAYKVALQKPHLRDQLAKYLLSAFVPWELDTGKPRFKLNYTGLQELCRQWDCSEATLVERQRYRWISNVLHRGDRSSAAGDTYMHWRARNADWWVGRSQSRNDNSPGPSGDRSECDTELIGSLPATEVLFQLARKNILEAKSTSAVVGEVRKRFWSLMPPEYSSQNLGTSRLCSSDGFNDAMAASIFQKSDFTNQNNTRSLGEIANAIQRMIADTHEDEESRPVAGESNSESANSKDDTLATLTQEQRNIVNYIVQNTGRHGGCRGNQTLSLLHGAAGTGKSVVIRAVVKELEARGVAVVVTCPTGIGASHLPHGRTFHSAFKVGRTRCKRLPPNKLELLRLYFHEHVGMVIIDEVSMLDMELLVLMDQRLRALYDPSKIFGGLSILLVGDFLQLSAVQGVSLCKNLYTTDDKDGSAHARDLFRRFRVFQLKRQLRAEGCSQHQEVLNDCIALPSVVPEGARWNRDHSEYHPISRRVLEAVTKPLTQQDLLEDPEWLGDGLRILVTTNLDRAALTPCAALMLANSADELLFKWPRKLHTDVPPGIKTMLYDESSHPYMYGYFVKGAPAQVLDNSNGNLAWGVANGSPCRLHSMAWEDEDVTAEVQQKVRRALRNNDRIVDLSVPPDYINVVLVDSNYDPLIGDRWPVELNLDERWVEDEHGNHVHKQNIIIPIGLVKANAKSYKVRVGNASDQKQFAVYYEQHAVEMSLVMTIWKAQGATMSRVLLLLESATNKCSWEYEHLYVALSRVRSASKLRCFPLSMAFRRSAVRQLRPNIYTVKWLMSINEDGFWIPSPAIN